MVAYIVAYLHICVHIYMPICHICHCICHYVLDICGYISYNITITVHAWHLYISYIWICSSYAHSKYRRYMCLHMFVGVCLWSGVYVWLWKFSRDVTWWLSCLEYWPLMMLPYTCHCHIKLLVFEMWCDVLFFEVILYNIIYSNI